MGKGAPILVFQHWGLGDTVMCLPAIAHLRKAVPCAELHVAVGSRAAAALVERVGLADRVEVVGTLRSAAFLRWLTSLRAQTYRFAVVSSGISPWVGVALRALGGIRKVFGDPARGKAATMAYSGILEAEKPLHRVEANAAIAAMASGAPMDRPPRYPAVLGPRRSEGGRGGPSSKNMIGIHPGSALTGGAACKRIPDGLLRRLLLGLLSRSPDTEVVVFLGPDDRNLARSIPDDKRISAAAGLAIPDLIERVTLCDAVVGSDSAVGHIASLAGVPVVCVAGPTNMRLSRPWSEWTFIVGPRDDMECRPCHGTARYGDCPSDRACFQRIEVDDVIAAVGHAIDRRRDSPFLRGWQAVQA